MSKNRYVFGCTVTAALGGFLFGFDTAVISGTTRDLEAVFRLGAAALGFTVSAALIGTVLGSLVVGRPGDAFGRRRVLMALAVLYGVSAAGSALAAGWIPFLVYRFIGGLAIGGSSVMSPLYIAEISPARLRGRLVAVSQFNIVLGILAAFFSNYAIARAGIPDAWRWMLGVQVLPSLVFLALLFRIPESPRWLVRAGRTEEARTVLRRVEGGDVEAGLADIEQSLRGEAGGSAERLFSPRYRKPVAYAVLLAMFNQLSGINVIIYYAPRIFEMTGLAADASLLQSVVLGLTNLVFTVAAMSVIDRFGRKTLLLVGSAGMVAFQALVASAFRGPEQGGAAVLFYLVGFIAFFAFSQGTVIWVFLSEIFPNRVRAKGQALGSFTHWIMNAAIAWLFPVAARHPALGGGNVFLFFSAMMVLHFLFVWRMLPETKGKSLESIQRELGIR
jgi:sugar porter (SP) family MFS transporter